MSVPRGGDRGRSGAPSAGDDAPAESEDSKPHAAPSDKSMVVLSPARPRIADPRMSSTSSSIRPPKGMATPDQIDAFRELRTRLLSMAEAVGVSHFTTLVVPVSPGSGASFVARNLAVAFTLQEQRVAILVDCNVRNPTQHLALGTRTDEGGLFDYLEQPRAQIDRLIRATSIPGLHLIPAGRPPATPREYFSSQPMRMVMAALRQAPCYPFLDGPPSKGSPDARILSGLADFVILVAGYGLDTPDGIAQAAALFDRAKFAGVVFNEHG